MNINITMKDMKNNEKSFCFEQIINEIIDEYMDVSYENLSNDKHNLPIVYQLAFSDRLPSIFRNGFSREYAASAGGNFYCTGLYSTFDLNSTIKNSITKKSLYGDAIIKMGIKSYDRFFICNKTIAKQVYGKYFHPKDQLEILFKEYPVVLNYIKNSRYYNDIIQVENPRTAINVVAFHEALGGMQCRADDNLNKYDIRGFVFYGANDGNVSIIRDFKAIVPLSYSVDNGKTWKKDLFNERTFNNTAGDHDPIIFLGGNENYYINPRSYRVINGYMRVQRVLDKKYNLLDSETKQPISPIWFDGLSNMDDNGFATAVSREITDSDELFYVNSEGCYETPNDTYAFLYFSDL